MASGFNSCPYNLSKFVDSFLKLQTQKYKSYIRYTKDFIMKFSSIRTISENSFLVTMNASSLYANIDDEEVAETCFEKLEERKSKAIPSIFINSLIIMTLKPSTTCSKKYTLRTG